jgi:predicted RNA-binding protein with PIN domain
MHLLIDGHNLIGQIPGISLSDPDDEAQLVQLLRSYAVRKRARQVIVVFDHGVYGHPQSLNGYGVVCHFALSPQDADTQLIRRMKALARPREWALVTSDRAVVRAAQDCRVRVIDARAFAAELCSPTKRAKPAPAPDQKRDIHMSDAEIAEWMRIFGEEPEQP